MGWYKGEWLPSFYNDEPSEVTYYHYVPPPIPAPCRTLDIEVEGEIYCLDSWDEAVYYDWPNRKPFWYTRGYISGQRFPIWQEEGDTHWRLGDGRRAYDSLERVNQ